MVVHKFSDFIQNKFKILLGLEISISRELAEGFLFVWMKCPGKSV